MMANSVDNEGIIRPDSQVFSGTIVNSDGNEPRRVDAVMGVSSADDIGVAMQTIEKIVTAHPKVQPEPAPRTEVSNLGDPSVDLIVRPWRVPEDSWTVFFDLSRCVSAQR